MKVPKADIFPGLYIYTLMQLTIVICTHNRSALLERTLASLNRAHRPANCAINVLVVANACTDDTVAFLEDYQRQAAEQNRLPLIWLEEATA